jgi:pimeloyl-ACP methyl ester carboxylesterase/DNA-binding winged helix-turn-helix (wHTH) protein
VSERDTNLPPAAAKRLKSTLGLPREILDFCATRREAAENGVDCGAMIFSFGGYRLDTGAHVLMGDGGEVHLEPQVFDLLTLLVTRAPDLVSYDEMIAEIWGGRIVSDATVAARVSAARAAVGDDGKRQAVIRTHPKRGVQLVASVSEEGSAPPPPPVPALNQKIAYTTSSDGTAIAWAETGEGPPLLRGGHWLNHLENDWKSPVFGPLLERLARGRRLIRYDPRGTGMSERSLNGGAFEDFVDDMEAVADAAGLERFAIYAISQSVPIAIAFAARHPDRVSRMILNNGLVRGELARGETEKLEAMLAMIRAGWGVPGSSFMQAMATVFMPLSSRAELESLVETQLVSATPDTAAELRRRIAEIDVTAILGKVVCPLLVTHATGDAVQSPEQSKLIAAHALNARLDFVESPNHVVCRSDPIWEPCVRSFEDFLAEDG